MSIYVLMTVRNEAHRFLQSCLDWASWYADEIFVYDDQSTDSTVDVARHYASVVVRPDSVPTFMEHEGRFRNAALQAMVNAVNVKTGDWVHVVDADEFLFTQGQPVKFALESAVQEAEQRGANAVRIPIPTVWGGDVREGVIYQPHVRVDRFWNNLAEPRLWRYQEGAKFLDRPMACRNEPTYVRSGIILARAGLFQLHYGYALPGDRQERYTRYSSLEDHGHHPDFIESIQTTAPVKVWQGPWKPVRIGTFHEGSILR